VAYNGDGGGLKPEDRERWGGGGDGGEHGPGAAAARPSHRVCPAAGSLNGGGLPSGVRGGVGMAETPS
jgi:hypothetical protein